MCNQHVDAAMAFNAQADNNQSLTRSMLTLKVHVNENNPKAKPADPKDASPETLADLTVQRVLSKFLSGPAAKAAIEAAYKRLDPDANSPVGEGPVLPIARLAFAAVLVGEHDVGLEMAQRALGGKNPQARAWADLVAVHVALESATAGTGEGSCRLTKGDVTKLSSVLEDLEGCLQALLAVKDVDGIHAACRCAIRRHFSTEMTCTWQLAPQRMRNREHQAGRLCQARTAVTAWTTPADAQPASHLP